MAAFAIDIGYIVLVRAQLQNAADAASLAAVLELTAAVPADDQRDNAIAEAIKVAGYNVADGRSVYAEPDDVYVGFRQDESNTTWYPAVDNSFNAVRVTPRRDDPAGAPGTDDALTLWFANFVFAYFGNSEYKQSVRGDSRAYLAPRDLVFVIDRSGSMSFDSYTIGNTSSDAAMAKPVLDSLFGDTYGTTGTGGNWRGTRNLYPSSTFPSGTGYTPYKTLYDWVRASSQMTFDKSKTGNKLTQDQFFAQEFPSAELPSGSGSTEHWKHWKWAAYCDYLWNRANNDNANPGISSSHVRYFGIYTYVEMLIHNGYGPAYRGQRFTRRASSGDYQLYPMPAADTSDRWKDFYLSSGDGYDFRTVFIKPICYVRRATLAALEEVQKKAYVGSETQDRAGFVSYGTKATKDMLLKSDMSLVKRAAANVVSGSWGAGVTATTGVTNTHMGLTFGMEVITQDAGSRSFSNKVVVLLSDGVCNVTGHTPPIYYGDSPGDVTASANKYAIDAAKKIRDSNCRLHVIGLGEGQDPIVMKAMADAGGGTYFAVGEDGNIDEDELTDVFVNIAQDRLGKFFTD